LTYSSIRFVPLTRTALVDTGVGANHTLNAIRLFMLLAWVADAARVALGTDADQVPNLRKG